ncbi:MAG: DUF4907 domain-containing protein [Candidatus Paceibacterota bacterium]|jgi:hypothetical protein
MNKKNLKILIIIVLIIIIAVILFFVSKPKVSGVVQEQKEVSPYLNSKIEIKTFQTGIEWGYDILIDENIYVHQPTIPAIGGNKGFKTEQDAQKTAELVVNKIRKNILPPSITPEELKNLGIE